MTPSDQRKTLAVAAAVLAAGTVAVLWPESGPRNVEITWQHPSTNVEFIVYSAPTPSLAAMTPRVQTASRLVRFPASQTQEFFAVRAVRGTNLSPWGTK